MKNLETPLELAKDKVERISQSARRWIVPLARFGYAAKGVVYIIIGILAALAAFTTGGRTTDSRGAMEEILSQSYGKLLLGAVAVGLAGYAVWRIVQAVKDTENKGSGVKGVAVRFGYAVSGIIHAGLALSAARMIFGSSESGGGEASSKEWTAKLLEQPFGQWLVAAGGLGFIIFALAQIYKAYSTKFREKLETGEMSDGTENFAVRTGQVGLVARNRVRNYRRVSRAGGSEFGRGRGARTERSIARARTAVLRTIAARSRGARVNRIRILYVRSGALPPHYFVKSRRAQ